MHDEQELSLLINQPNINYLWAAILVEELRRQGIDHFFLSPGSRSAPLLSAAGHNKGIISTIHFDERSLAFMACGYCSSSGKSAVLVCTSGTAAANFLPAVIEASKKKLPLIILTADRPPELQKTGAAQTIEQNNLYGSYVRWSFDFPCPTTDILPEFILTTAAQIVSRSKGELTGPVHLNVMFRDPLFPKKSTQDLSKYVSSIKPWSESDQPYTKYFSKRSTLTQDSTSDAISRINSIRNGLILCGKISGSADRESIITFSQRTGFPIFADITSGLRLGKKSNNVISYFDQILLNKELPLDFDGIIHFGGRMTSQRFYDLLERLPLKEYLMIIGHPLRSDPLHKVTSRFILNPASFIDCILSGIPERHDSNILEFLQKQDLKADEQIKQMMLNEGLSENFVARAVSEGIPDGDGLFLSNSMPIRNMDMFASFQGKNVIVGANRGASGIDGIISSAAGFAQGINRSVTLVIGDLAFLCDLNGLALLRSIKQKLIIIIMNNNGGGIFSKLPISSDVKVFEKFFTAPHGLSFSGAAQMFNIYYVQPITSAEFNLAYSNALISERSVIIEVNTSVRTHAHSTNK